MKILTLFGTRPEAIKMAPLVRQLRLARGSESLLCVTGQHQAMLQQVMALFQLKPDFDLGLMAADQTLSSLSSKLLDAIDRVLVETSPDRVLVHGDTTTAMAASLAAFHRRIPVGHVEAGLRTGDLSQPWPEEMNRRVVDVVADMLFAPTPSSRANLLKESLGGAIYVTGNTVIDALRVTDATIRGDGRLRESLDAGLPRTAPGRKLLLVTGHRRENFGAGFANICSALAELARCADIEIVYPVHLNPNVQKPVRARLSHCANVHLIEPLDYLQFVRMMQRAHIILTDSGGIQEEASYLGKPLLVMRDVTERPEAVLAGAVRLVGTEPARIVHEVRQLCGDRAQRAGSTRAGSPYGDGHACRRIIAALAGEAFSEFAPDGAGAGRPAASLVH